MIFHALTAVLFVLKVIGTIDISWWLVLAPSLVVITFTVLILLGVGSLAVWAKK